MSSKGWDLRYTVKEVGDGTGRVYVEVPPGLGSKFGNIAHAFFQLQTETERDLQGVATREGGSEAMLLIAWP